MANEISFSGELSVSNGNHVPPAISESGTADQAAVGLMHNVQNIGTGGEALTTGDISTAGYAFFKNLDATNFVHIYDADSASQDFIKILPGKTAGPLPLGTLSVSAKADTAAVNLEYWIFEA